MATGYVSCSALRNQFSFLSNTYRRLQDEYRRSNASRNGNIAYDHRRVMNDYQSLSVAVRSLNGRVTPRPYPRYPRTRPLPRHPRTRPIPRPRHPRTRPVPRPVPPRTRPLPRNPRRGGTVNHPRRPNRRPSTTPPRRRGNGRRGRNLI